MRPTEQLRNEHEGVLLALRILEAICDAAGRDRRPDHKHLDQLLEFLRVFVDRCHHGKEEDLLFPAMVAVGVPKDAGPVAVMLAEHQQGRGYIKAMAEAVAAFKGGDPKAVKAVVQNAGLYITLLRQHIEKENHVLFRMAEAQLSKATQDELLAEFERIEKERIGEGRHEQFHQMLHDLSAVYLPSEQE